MHCSSHFLHAPRPQIQVPLAGLISPTSMVCCLGSQSIGEARLHCSQKNPTKPKPVFPSLCPSPLQELWWCLGFFFYSYTSPSDDLTLVTYEHPLLSWVCSSVNLEQFGSVWIHLKAYLYIKVSLFKKMFILCVFLYVSYCWINLEVLLSLNRLYVPHPQPPNINSQQFLLLETEKHWKYCTCSKLLFAFAVVITILCIQLHPVKLN